MKTGSAIFFAMFLYLNAEAITVFKVKGQKVLINLEGQAVSIGQQLRVVDANNKPVALLKVLNVAKDKALATTVGGSPAAGNKILTVGTATPQRSQIADGPRVPYKASVLLGLASNTLSIRVGDGQTSQNVDNTGNSVGVAIAADRQYFKPWFKARALVAYEQFNAVGAATIKGCDNQTSRDCTTDIKYLSGGLYGKYEQEFGAFRGWGAVGLNLKFPFAKSSTALVESSLGTTLAYGLTLGADYVLETKNFVTASLEKQFFLKSDSAETSTVFIRIGVGKEF